MHPAAVYGWIIHILALRLTFRRMLHHLPDIHHFVAASCQNTVKKVFWLLDYTRYNHFSKTVAVRTSANTKQKPVRLSPKEKTQATEWEESELETSKNIITSKGKEDQAFRVG